MGLSHGFGDYWYFLNFCCLVCVPFCRALRTWGRWVPGDGVPTSFWEQPPTHGCPQRCWVWAESRSGASPAWPRCGAAPRHLTMPQPQPARHTRGWREVKAR